MIDTQKFSAAVCRSRRKIFEKELEDVENEGNVEYGTFEALIKELEGGWHEFKDTGCHWQTGRIPSSLLNRLFFPLRAHP